MTNTTPQAALLREAAYDKVDRLLRSNLDDADYAEYSNALEALSQPAQPAAYAPNDTLAPKPPESCTRLAQPAEGGEVVAWSVLDKRTGKHWFTHESKSTAQHYATEYSHRESDGSPSMVVKPLYTTPPASQEQPEHPMACWSVDVHDDDDGRTWINIRNPDDDVACLSVKTMVRRGRRSIAASVLYEFHAAWQAMHCQPAQAAQAALDDVRVAVRVAVLAEREACAKVCAALVRNDADWDAHHWNQAVQRCEHAIRARTDAAMLSASPAAKEGGE